MSFIKYLISKQFGKQVVIVIIIFTSGFFGLKQWLNKTTNHNEVIEVPNLAKLSVQEVKMKLTQLDLRMEVIDSSSYNPNYPKKSVISQFPERASLVKKNRKIYLTLNPSKFGKVQVPIFYGKTKNEVIAELKSSGFEIGRILFIPDIGRNVVRRLKSNGILLTEGDKLDKHSTIDIILGNGKGR